MELLTKALPTHTTHSYKLKQNKTKNRVTWSKVTFPPPQTTKKTNKQTNKQTPRSGHNKTTTENDTAFFPTDGRLC